jgi:hypothetical protein
MPYLLIAATSSQHFVDHLLDYIKRFVRIEEERTIKQSDHR